MCERASLASMTASGCFYPDGKGMSDTAKERIEVVFSAEVIAARIDIVAQRIAEAGLSRLLVVAVLKGSFVFAADLIRALHRRGISPEVDFITLSSYRTSTKSSGVVEI